MSTAFTAVPVLAQQNGITDTRNSKSAVVNSTPIDAVRWTGGFWGERFGVFSGTSVQSMWETWKSDRGHSYNNFLIAAGEKKGKDTWYNVHLENGWIYRRSSNVPLDWSGKIKEFVVSTELDETGNPKVDKDGNVKRSFRAPKEDDWNLLKKKSESILDQSKLTVGTYIYESLLNVPNQKIRGKLIRTIERKYYKEELKTILEVQKNFHPELNDRELYYACVNELYPSNESHREILSTHDFTYLLIEDMLFYQRPLKSKVSLIADCPYEARIYKDKEGNKCSVALKCIAKSHPLFQEFRLWQFISNLRIYQREKKIGTSLKTDVDVTSEFLRNEDDYVALFDCSMNRKILHKKNY